MNSSRFTGGVQVPVQLKIGSGSIPPPVGLGTRLRAFAINLLDFLKDNRSEPWRLRSFFLCFCCCEFASISVAILWTLNLLLAYTITNRRKKVKEKEIFPVKYIKKKNERPGSTP